MIAPVFLRFAVSQLSSGALIAKENGTATHSRAYRALNASGGRKPRIHAVTEIHYNRRCVSPTGSM